ncbi:hypothetical protein CWO90_03845 [Bradyrhizobium sp. Leo121]|nr:hypothetical protein CWO90_03845 [Bradyrhizobium sp. Leo121]
MKQFHVGVVLELPLEVDGGFQQGLSDITWLRGSAKTAGIDVTVFTTSTIHRIDEAHHLRYWFPFEVEALLGATGFEPIGHYAWLSTTSPPNSRDWAAYSIARKKTVQP